MIGCLWMAVYSPSSRCDCLLGSDAEQCLSAVQKRHQQHYGNKVHLLRRELGYRPSPGPALSSPISTLDFLYLQTFPRKVFKSIRIRAIHVGKY